MGLATTGQAGISISAAAVGALLKRFPWKSLLARFLFCLPPESVSGVAPFLLDIHRLEGVVRCPGL